MKQNVKWTKLFAILMLVFSVLTGPLEAFAQDVSSASDVEELVSSSVNSASTNDATENSSSEAEEEAALPQAQAVNVNGTPKVLHNAVKSAIVWDYNNAREASKDADGNYVLREGSLFGFEMEFDLADYDYNLNNGDYFEYEIPAPLTVQEGRFALIDRPTGISVGVAEVTSNGDGQGGSVHISMQNLEKYLEAKKADAAYGVKGSFFVQFRSDVIKTPVTVRLKEKGVAASVDIVLKVDPRGPASDNGPYLQGENFNKYWGVMIEDPWESAALGTSGTYAHPWRVRLNASKANYNKYVVNDEISADSAGMQFIPETFRLLSGSKINQNWGLDGEYMLREGIDYSIRFSDNYTKFSMTIFDPSGKPFILDYKTTAPGDGTNVGNVISVQGDDQPIVNNAYNNSTREEVRRRSRLTEGGAIQLNVAYRIVINKVDAETKKPLAGAVFKVTDPDGNEFRLAPTGADGSTISDEIKDALAAKGTFKIQEETAPEGYELSTDVTEVTVTESGVIRTIENKKRSTEFKATKVWAGDQDASKRPAAKFQLKRDGANYGDAKDVPQAGGEVSWTNLPYYQDGKNEPSVYTVEETGVEGTGYEVAYSDQTATSATVTNTYRNTEFKATKVWAGDQDATKRPAVKFQLKRDGANYGDAKDVPQAGGEVSWTNLPYYQDGKTDPSVYTVEETGVEGTGYEVAYSDQTATSTTVTNTYRSTEFKATKVWAGDQDATKRPAVKFQLKRDGANYGDAKDVPQAGGEVSWTNLPYYQDGKTEPSVYTVEETGVEGTGYEVAYSNQTATSATVTNTYRSTEFKATKVWAGDQDTTKRPAAKFQLKRDGANYGDAKDVPQAGGEVTWTNLPYYQDGKTDPSVYTVEETGVEGTGYDVAYSNQSATSVTVTNTYRTTEFKVTKVWAGDQDASKRPSVKFQLKRDGANYGEAKDVPKEGGLVTWTNLPYYQDGKSEPSVYTVEELTETPNGYEVTYTSDANGSVTVTNTFKTTGFVASKVWKGDKDPSVRPQAQFQLYRDGVAYGQPQAVPTVDGQVAWTNLPYYQEGKNEASVYTVQEVQAVDSPYAATYADQTASTVTVTNTLQNKTTSFTVNKQWRGFEADMKRPNAKFQLKRDGQAYGELRDVPKEDGQVVWTDLPLYQDGTTTPSVYTVDELDPTNQGGYEWKVENLTASSATVINSRKPVDQPPTPPTPSGKRELPKTGEHDTFLTGLAGLSFLLAAAYVISPVRRRN
ncbi:Cna B-type domain-containing protein [Abiotrophia defectiva]|uniref:Cna B-type domain-containing protein n=1 Tax=Abiotrophia defectiva TaxID=46125 RepID=UPI0028D6F2CF|nr:Cna B-type domain-containing protein [Abiotrophia defectiva]